MEQLHSLFSAYAGSLPFISLGLLILAGLNMPVSEDLVFIISAAVAAVQVPDLGAAVFAGCFAGAYISDIMVYATGRYGGRKLFKSGFVSRKVSPSMVGRAEAFFGTYGPAALFFGRFIPFGVRNVLFLTAGISKMPVVRFMFVDLAALCVTSSILFSLGYWAGSNYEKIAAVSGRVNMVIFIIFVSLTALFCIRKLRMKSPEAGDKSSC